jgi:hypothetical protein
MKNSVTDNHSAVENVRQQFQDWRSSRIKQEPIPEHLWHAAIGLCRSHSISHVSQRLRLSYADLKKRVNLSQPYPQVDCQRSEFTEINFNSLFPTQDKWQLFCQRCDGSFLKLSGSGEHPTVADILKGFLS